MQQRIIEGERADNHHGRRDQGVICRADEHNVYDDAAQRIAAPGNSPDDPIDLAAHFEQVHVIIGDALDSLRLIAVPPGEAARTAAVYAKVDKLQKDAPAYSAALSARNQAAVAAARKQVAADETRANAAAAKYGLTACSF